MKEIIRLVCDMWPYQFCDHLEIVILSLDLHRLLKNMQGELEIKPSPALGVLILKYQKI